MPKLGDQGQKLELTTYAYPRPGLTADELAAMFDELGNRYLEIDRKNNRLVVSRDQLQGASE